MRLADELFAFYERCPGIAKARADQHKFEALRDLWACGMPRLRNSSTRR
jgi:hypothetical protein